MFFRELAETVKSRFEEILEQPTLFGFRKVRIPLFPNESAVGNDLSLCVGDVRVSEDDRSTFKVRKSENSFQSFRSPQRIEMHYSLVAKSLSVDQKLTYLERLHNSLFSSRVFPPFVPEDYKNLPELAEKMRQMRAEIVPLDSVGERNDWAFYFPFLYRGPFHNGQPLDEGTLVKKKVIEYQNTAERSAL